jgi:hypothetical protein
MKSVHNKKMHAFLLTIFLPFAVSLLYAGNPDEKTVFSSLPVKEITVFKDGHVFVLHEGKMPTDKSGNVVLDYLPNPVIGTFWAYSADPKVKLSSVVSGSNIVSLENTALNVPDLIEANIGKRVLVRDCSTSDLYEATIVAVPERSTEELAATSKPSEGPKLPVKAGIVLLKVAGGIKAVPIETIKEITFLDNPSDKISYKDFRNTMTLKLDWKDTKIRPNADVGMAYVQKGIRWIPSYKIDIDGNGNAIVKLQATIINELTDLENVKAHLVIGVPTFAFKDTIDPISLQQTFAQLSPYFQADSRTAYGFSNAIATQVVRMRETPQYAESDLQNRPVDLGPELKGSEKNEDLFIFSVDNITLKKGQRMVIPITQYTLKYSDVYKLDLPFSPPMEMRRYFDSSQQLEIAKLLNAPKVKHNLRLINDSEYPLTTAPALILRNGKVISQAMITYTAIGGKGDLEMSTAVDVTVKTTNKQTQFTPNALNLNGSNYSKIDMLGKVELKNHKQQPVKIEVKRNLFGAIDSANLDGQIELTGFGLDGWSADDLPTGWNSFNWPWWWYHANSFGKINWELELKPGQQVDLEYNWHYFWLP